MKISSKTNSTPSAARVAFIALLTWLMLCLITGVALRIALLCHPLTQASSLSIGQWIGSFALGAINDLCVAILFAIPLGAFLMSSGHWRFRKPQCFIFLLALILGWTWVAFGAQSLWEFNRPVARIIRTVMIVWIVTFTLRAFCPKMRRWWMMFWTAVLIFIYIGLFMMNTVGEWFFWNEFGVRYNFIAVDYLIYTNEVIGNIMQSYSMGWIITGAVTATLLLEILLYRKIIIASAQLYQPGWRLKVGSAMALAAILSIIVLPLTEKAQHSPNAWYNGLQANGVYSFAKAFTTNELDYNDFYVTCPEAMLANTPHATDTIAEPADSAITPNIVLITMESMSADYMRTFGNANNLTPVLDSLWTRSIAFNRMFAAGNRTVRGLEALILSRPPSPGESIIKRPHNTGFPSIVDPLKAQGYTLAFYYGGNSYFDNMESFFSGLGYDICDRKTMPDSTVTCQTIWGVCDGDVYTRLVNDINNTYSTSGHPFFAHVLTTSNHRPYIYPDNCVSISPTSQSREGAVMYSDYALGQFLNDASQQPWFANTVFVISADHCASSAGSTELPLENYHIPALIYAPQLLDPTPINTTASQIDIFPTLFARLGWESNPQLYGTDILSDTYKPRAFVATYQDLGYLSGDTLTVLSPGRNYRQFIVDPTPDNPYATSPVTNPDMSHIYQAATIYQHADSESKKTN